MYWIWFLVIHQHNTTMVFQEHFLKVICKIYLFCLKLFGLWPFTYDAGTKSFSLNLIYAFIPLVLVPFFTILSVRDFDYLLDEVKIVFRNIVLKMVSTAYIVSNLIFAICIYGTQYGQYERIKKLFRKIMKLATSYELWFPLDEVNYLPQLVKFTVRTFVFSLLYQMYHVASVSFIAPNKFGVVTVIAFVLPSFIVKLYPDIFYGGMLAAHFYLHQINKEIRDILNAVIALKRSPNGNLSNKLQIVAIHYFKLIECVREFNSLTSLRVLLWLFITLLNFVVHVFMQYVFFGVSQRYGEVLNIAIAVTGLTDTLLQFFEFWFTTSSCSKVQNEIGTTETMLCSMYIHLLHDDRFREIVYTFVDRIKHENLEISGAKLFVIDSRLIYSIVSSTFSFFVILIQFELSAQK